MAGESDKALVPVLDDLMKYHMYIGCSQEDKEMVRKLLELMKNNGLKYSHRGSPNVKEQSQEQSQADIKRGIVFSHKCLLYISPAYLQDPNSQLELKEAERKLKLLGKNSVFGIVQSNVQSTHPTQLERYKQFQLIFLKDGQTVQDCLSNYLNRDAILKDYELKMELQFGPRESTGVGVAYNYFFGFLQLIIPDFWQQFKEAMANYGIKDENLVKKMLIIIRKSVNSPPRLNEPGVEQTKFSIKQTFARAGKERREYTLSIYKLAANDRKKNDIYCIADFPACLFALQEAFGHELNMNMMSKDEVFEARNEFVLTVKALLSLQKNQAKFQNQWELLLWPDDTEDRRVELKEFLHQQIESKSLTEFSRDVTLPPPVDADDDRVTFTVGRGLRDYPMYAEGAHYNLKYSNRGYCVIISNYDFDKASGLENRDGGKAEIEKLEKLFETLKFEVRTHKNLTSDGIKTELAKYSEVDHSESDAFVCCLLSHGSKGRMSGVDGKSISVVELMELFYDSECPGLKGKPKLFFIGTCQSGDVKEVENVQTTSLRHVAGGARPDPEPDPSAKLDPNFEIHSTKFMRETAAHIVCEGRPDPEEPYPNPEEPDPNANHDPNFKTHSTKFTSNMIPPTFDFIVSYACLPGTAAWHDEKVGGLYVQALCKHLNQDLEIEVALRYVNQEVRGLLNTYDKEGKKYSRQDPFHIIMPPQKFLFLGSA